MQGRVGRLVGLAPELDGRLLAGALRSGRPGPGACPGRPPRRGPRRAPAPGSSGPRSAGCCDPRAAGPNAAGSRRPPGGGRRPTAGSPRQQPVQQRRVLGVVEAELLEPPFEAPVRLADEQEARVDVADGAAWRATRTRRTARPPRPPTGATDRPPQVDRKTSSRTSIAIEQTTPSQRVATSRERLGHRPRHLGMAVVELGGIRPRREVRVATVGDPVAPIGADLEEFVGDRRRAAAASAWTYQSGCRRTHGCSDEVWFGTKSRIRPRPASARRARSRPARPRRRGCRPARRR